MSSQDISLIDGFDTARGMTNRYLTIVVFIIGGFGNIFNVIVFSQPTLSQVPTSRYFIAASGASLASLTSGLLGRTVSGWAADPASRNTPLCKFQAYTNALGQTSCSYFILAATIDRWLQSNININRRHMSSIKNSTRAIIMILFVFSIYHSIHAICFEAFQEAPPIKCYAGSITCRYFQNISYAVITVLIPQLMMLYFGWKTICNLRQFRRRVHVLTTHNSVFLTNTSHVVSIRTANQAKMRSLTRMLIIQVFTYIFLTLPVAAYAFYMTLALADYGSVNTDVQLAIDRFCFAFTSLLTYVAISLPFYLYTLTGPIFRHIVVKLLTKLKCCLIHH